MNIQSIWMKVRLGQYVVSFSHTEKICSRMISLEEIETAILRGTIIEPYSDDSRGPSCALSLVYLVNYDRFMLYAEIWRMMSC